MSKRLRRVRNVGYIFGWAMIATNLIGRNVYDGKGFGIEIITSLVIAIIFTLIEIINVSNDESQKINIVIIAVFLCDFFISVIAQIVTIFI